MIRVRIAPSPTGNLHIGTARTALFNWLFAKSQGGEFILRIEDTDLERSNKKYEEDIVAGLTWLGLDWHNKEIFRQSERLDIYAKYLKELLDSNKAFWCDHSKEELETEQKEQSTRKEAPRHICNHKNKKLEKGQIIRLSVNTDSKEKISFKDEIRGNIEWEAGLLGDFSLAKDLKIPLYNFAAVIDDMEMEISHVIRGEDHISNTPKQLLIYRALGKEPPKFAHLPLILGSDKSKLSKRHGATSIIEYKKDYLPEAMINFMGFIGYTQSKEILSKEEMVQEFTLEKVHKSGAIFDVKKLNWINSQYIKNLTSEKFKKLANVPELSDEAVRLITERLEKLSDVQNFDYLWKDPRYDKELLKWKKSDLETSLKTLVEVKKLIEEFDFKKEKDELRKILDDLSATVGDRGLVYWPLRTAITGQEKSPDPVDIIFAIEKEKTLERIDFAIK
ncbi:MAG: glutamate--tRNA ligase [bacterium]|nr:glutamate--tRNA ligase [bacterium]